MGSEGHGDLGVAHTLLRLDGSLVDTVQGPAGLPTELFDSGYHGSGTVDDKGAQTGVALFGDASEASAVFARSV